MISPKHSTYRHQKPKFKKQNFLKIVYKEKITFSKFHTEIKIDVIIPIQNDCKQHI